MPKVQLFSGKRNYLFYLHGFHLFFSNSKFLTILYPVASRSFQKKSFFVSGIVV